VRREQLGADDAQALLRSVLPDIRVAEVIPCRGGQTNTVFEVRCAGAADAPLIVKAYADQWRWKLAKEVDVYRILARHGVGPIPDILYADLDPGHSGLAFVVMTMLPGRSLGEVSDDLDATQTGRLYGQMGAALSAIHRIGQDAYGYRVNPDTRPAAGQHRVHDTPVHQETARVRRSWR
jgi:hypothetical protein